VQLVADALAMVPPATFDNTRIPTVAALVPDIGGRLLWPSVIRWLM